jgi:N,N'-diacetyllegionaminate synthase
MKQQKIQKVIEKAKKGILIIVDAGKNFIQTEEEKSVEEYLNNAKKLVDAAVESGADIIKWQTHNVEDEQLKIKVVSPHFKGGERYSWVSRNTKATPVNEFWKPLKAYCEEKNILFMSTPMSRGAAYILEDLDVDFWKIGSGDILDFVMLDFIRNTDKPIFISSGMSTMDELEKSINFLREKNDQIFLFHCVSQYPCPVEDLHLGTIQFFKEKFDIPIGFSDHSVGGIEQDLLAVAAGATILEKHFSFSRDLWGADHKVSMTPDELKELVLEAKDLINNTEKKERMLLSDFGQRALEGKNKILQDGESVFRPLFRKSLMAAKDIKSGTKITADMLFGMRPQKYAGGLPTEEYCNVLGKTLSKDIKKFDPIVVDLF